MGLLSKLLKSISPSPAGVSTSKLSQSDIDMMDFEDTHGSEADRKKMKLFNRDYPYSLYDKQYSPDKHLKYYEETLQKWNEYRDWCLSLLGGEQYYKENDEHDYDNFVSEFESFKENDYPLEVEDYESYLAEQHQIAEMKKYLLKEIRKNVDGVRRTDLYLPYPDSYKHAIDCAANSLMEAGKISREKIANRIVYKPILINK